MLQLLTEFRVSGFSVGGMQIAFKDGEGELPKAVIQALDTDDGYTTSPRRVGGFSKPPAEGFRHPSLWGGQNGKTLKFTGELE